MPSDDYTASTIRGSLKLKGGPSKPEGIKKKKKKKKKPTAPSTTTSLQKAHEDEDEDAPAEGSSNTLEKPKSNKRKDKDAEVEEEELDDEQLRELDPRGGDGKTASERAYEEMRRKRLQERIQKEGPKTHKQRVEELNKYLSNLSEHHDMPKIGPG